MRKFFIAAVLIGAATLGSPSESKAGFIIALQQAGVNGGNITVVASGSDFQAGGITFGGVYGTFTFSGLGADSSTGVSLSDLLTGTIRLTNNSAEEQSITIWASQDGYSLPSGNNLRVESGLSGTVNTGDLSGAGAFQAFLDKNNNLLAVDGLTGGAAITDYSNGPQSGTFSGSTFDTGSATGLFTRTGDYSITSRAFFTVSGHGAGNFTTHVNVTPTPAPAGVVLALTGLPFLGIGTWLRRRKVKAQNS